MNKHHYKVTWIIDINAFDPRDAAERAQQIQLLHDSIATLYLVTDVDKGTTTAIDLEDCQ